MKDIKATQFITNETQSFTETELFPAAKMGGVLTAKISENTYEGFYGFGVAITGASCYNLYSMPIEERTALLKKIYSADGLNLSIARISVASSDYSAELYSYDDVEGDIELKHFSVDRDKKYIIPIIKEILAIRPDLYIYASPWSPPGWMKTGNSMCGGYMREEFLDCYAEYIIKFIKAYRDEGIEIKALTPQNETETTQNGKMPACAWHPDFEAKFIIMLREKLTENGLDVKIWAHDHNFSNTERVLWQLETYKELKNAADGVAFHYYDGSIDSTDIIAEKYPELELHFTEGGPRLYDNYATDWCKWSLMLSKVLNHGYKSFMGWNLMLDETGGPNIGPFFCGGLVTLDRNDKSLRYSGQYKALKHFSPYLNDKTKVYKVEFSGNSPSIFGYPNLGMPVEGVMLETDSKKILNIVNPNKTKRQVQVELGGKWWYIELLPNTVSTVIFE